MTICVSDCVLGSLGVPRKTNCVKIPYKCNYYCTILERVNYRNVVGYFISMYVIIKIIPDSDYVISDQQGETFYLLSLPTFFDCTFKPYNF